MELIGYSTESKKGKESDGIDIYYLEYTGLHGSRITRRDSSCVVSRLIEYSVFEYLSFVYVQLTSLPQQNEAEVSPLRLVLFSTLNSVFFVSNSQFFLRLSYV